MTSNTLRFNFFLLLFLRSFLFFSTHAHANANAECRNYYSPKTKGKFFDINKANLPFDAHQASQSIWKILIRPDSNSTSLIAGTLFFVSNNGHFLTNWHVLANFIQALENKGMLSIVKGYHSEKGAIKLKTIGKVMLFNEATNSKIPIENLYLNFIPAQKTNSSETTEANFDFIVGQIENVNIPSLNLNPSFEYKRKTKVFSLGYPEKDTRLQQEDSGADGGLKASTGNITSSYFYRFFNKTTLLTSLPLSGGSSGSPILSSDGSVIGIVSGGGYHSSNLNEISTVGVTISTVIKELNKFPSSAYLKDLLVKN